MKKDKSVVDMATNKKMLVLNDDLSNPVLTFVCSVRTGGVVDTGLYEQNRSLLMKWFVHRMVDYTLISMVVTIVLQIRLKHFRLFRVVT